MPWPSLHGKPESFLQASEKPGIASPKLGMVNINVTQSGQKRNSLSLSSAPLEYNSALPMQQQQVASSFNSDLTKTGTYTRLTAYRIMDFHVMTEEGHMAVRAMETKF